MAPVAGGERGSLLPTKDPSEAARSAVIVRFEAQTHGASANAAKGLGRCRTTDSRESKREKYGHGLKPRCLGG